jgi:hypothetical protein
MRNLLAFLAAVTLTIAGIGFYLGWFRVLSTAESPGHKNVNIEVNTIKIGEDLQKGGRQVENLIQKARQGSGSKIPGGQEPAEAGPPAPSHGCEAEPVLKGTPEELKKIDPKLLQ